MGLAVGDVIKTRIITYHGTLPSAHLGINVLHWEVTTSTLVGATEQEVATALDAAWKAAYKNCMSAEATYRGVTCQRIWPLPAGVEFWSAAGQGPGSQAGNVMPSFCGFIRKRSIYAGKENRGRIYVSFPSEADNDIDAAPTAGYMARLAALATAIDTFQTVVGVGGTITLVLSIWHRKFPGTWTRTESITTEDEWASQRKRMNRGKLSVVPI